MIANFRQNNFNVGETSIPARSLLIAFTDTGESFVYQNSALAEVFDNSGGIGGGDGVGGSVGCSVTGGGGKVVWLAGKLA